VSITIQQLIERIGGIVRQGDPAVSITGVDGIERAGPEQLSFIANLKYFPQLKTTNAAAIIVPDNPQFWEAGGNSQAVLIAHPEPYYAFMLALRVFHPEDEGLILGIDPSAAIGEAVEIGENACIGKNAVIEAHAHIGAGSIILPGCYVGRNARIGARTKIGPNVTVMHQCELGDRVRIHPGTVIGADGFGYANLNGIHHKIPQVGKVVVEDDVEIGACVCIDRATMGETRIRKGTKIDNLVQIAHNVQVGENTIIIAQVGISGSTKIGNNVILAGQVGLIGHIQIGDNVIIAAQSGVTRDIPENTKLLGSPARDLALEKRIHVLIGKLPEMAKRVRDLEKRLAELENQGKK